MNIHSEQIISKSERFVQMVEVLQKYHAFKGMTPVKLRMILEDLGPTYVKLGQIMSSRSDILDPVYCKELESSEATPNRWMKRPFAKLLNRPMARNRKNCF